MFQREKPSHIFFLGGGRQALISVVPKVCYADRVDSATSSLAIRVYVSVMDTSKFILT